MSMTPITSQAAHSSVRALATSPAVGTTFDTVTNPTRMRWLGVEGSKGCHFGTYVAKRITPGRLTGGLT